jgi:hypothetical protein
MLSEVVTHAIERGTSDCLANPEAVQNGNTSRHQSFAARFLFGKMAALEELHLQATSSQQNRKCGTCNAAAGNKNVRHGYEANGHTAQLGGCALAISASGMYACTYSDLGIGVHTRRFR